MKNGFWIIFHAILTNIILANSECNYRGLILEPNFDPAKVPPFGDELVVTNVKLLKVLSIDDFQTTMTLVMKIYLNWKDSRIKITGSSNSTLTRLFERYKFYLVLSLRNGKAS